MINLTHSLTHLFDYYWLTQIVNLPAVMYPHIEETLVKAVYVCYVDFATTAMLYCLLLIIKVSCADCV